MTGEIEGRVVCGAQQGACTCTLPPHAVGSVHECHPDYCGATWLSEPVFVPLDLPGSAEPSPVDRAALDELLAEANRQVDYPEGEDQVLQTPGGWSPEVRRLLDKVDADRRAADARLRRILSEPPITGPTYPFVVRFDDEDGAP